MLKEYLLLKSHTTSGRRKWGRDESSAEPNAETESRETRAEPNRNRSRGRAEKKARQRLKLSEFRAMNIKKREPELAGE